MNILFFNNSGINNNVEEELTLTRLFYNTTHLRPTASLLNI